MKNQRRFISAMIVTIVAVFIFGRLHSRKKKAAAENVISPLPFDNKLFAMTL